MTGGFGSRFSTLHGPWASRPERRLPLVIAVLLTIAFGVGACTFGGNAVSQRQINLGKQKEVALNFRMNYPAVEKIRFTDEGGMLGFGAPWSVSAVVTLNGEDYHENLGAHAISGEPFPDVDSQSAPAPLLVIFSDGSTEVIE